jgi:hypothetical protein
VGLITLPCKKRKLLRSFQEISRILRRRPTPKLGCGAKERRNTKKLISRCNQEIFTNSRRTVHMLNVLKQNTV